MSCLICPNMNNFLDLLDTKTSLSIRLVISSLTQAGVPHVRVKLNQTLLFDGLLDQDLMLCHDLALLDPVSLEIEMKDKIYHPNRETAVLIKSLTLDDFEMVPNWTHLCDYQNDHGENVPTSYLGFNGVWTFKTHRPFYQWRHLTTGQGWLLEPTT